MHIASTRATLEWLTAFVFWRRVSRLLGTVHCQQVGRILPRTSYRFARLTWLGRLLYTALVRIITSFKIVASKEEPPNTDYVDYNLLKSALVAIPRDFKVQLIPRGPQTLAECMKQAEERTQSAYA